MAQEVALPQGTIRYTEDGSGRPIVFVHGVLVNGRLWRDVAPALADGFRVVVPDWPLGAHELPLRPDADVTLPGLARMVADFLEALELEDAVLVGCDTGTAIAQRVAADHPARVGALVLTNGDALERFFPPIFRFLSVTAKLPGSSWLIGQTLRIKRLQRLPVTFGWLTKRPIADDVMSAYVEPLLSSPEIRRDARRVLAAVSKRYTLEAAEQLRGFERPVLLPWAVEDRVFPLDLAERLATRLPNVHIEPIEDSYAFVPEDRPERLAELIRDFAG